jgi:enediyne biosynthesis protein E4
VFINNEGNGFTAIPLPAKAQFSAGFYAGVADMDNNGIEDIFISQNFFPVSDPQSNPRLDAGRSLWLKGDGNGGFEAVPAHVSGVKIYGEQRGAALGDFNQNGRVDLAVSQNSAETRLFLNQSEKRGYRVTLSGPPGNSAGIGSGIRLIYDDQSKGPVRTIQAGSGYWSQNSFTQVLGASSEPADIEINWFDGTHQTIEIENGVMDYIISYPQE